MTLTVFGNDILEDGGYIVRPFDAGAFAFQYLKKAALWYISWIRILKEDILN